MTHLSFILSNDLLPLSFLCSSVSFLLLILCFTSLLCNSPVFHSIPPSPFCPPFFSITFVLSFSDFATLLPPVLLMRCPLYSFLSLSSSLMSHCYVLPLLPSFHLCVFSSTLLLSLFASAVITTHSFNPLPLQSSEVEVTGDFCLKLSARGTNNICLVLLSLFCSPISCLMTRVVWGKK